MLEESHSEVLLGESDGGRLVQRSTSEVLGGPGVFFYTHRLLEAFRSFPQRYSTPHHFEITSKASSSAQKRDASHG